MSVRLGVLFLAVAGCATAPVHDDSAERINDDMAPEKTQMPSGLPMGEAPALAPADPASSSGTYSPRRGRMYRHLTPTESDYYTGQVTVPAVTTGTNPVMPTPVPAQAPAAP